MILSLHYTNIDILKTAKKSSLVIDIDDDDNFCISRADNVVTWQ